jgi:hypothetical protein
LRDADAHRSATITAIIHGEPNDREIGSSSRG